MKGLFEGFEVVNITWEAQLAIGFGLALAVVLAVQLDVQT